MRGWWMMGLLALAGCGENQGWNPNYQFGNDPYGRYRAGREAALVTGDDVAPTIPIALPVHAPTGAQIAGADPVPVPPSMGVRIVPVPASPGMTRPRTTP